MRQVLTMGGCRLLLFFAKFMAVSTLDSMGKFKMLNIWKMAGFTAKWIKYIREGRENYGILTFLLHTNILLQCYCSQYVPDICGDISSTTDIFLQF